MSSTSDTPGRRRAPHREAVTTQAAEGGDLEAVFREHAALVARVGLRLLGRKHETDDLVQDVFLMAGKWLARVEPGALRGWLITVTVRMAGRRLRTRRVRMLMGFDSGLGDEDLVDDQASAAHRELVTDLYRVLDRMPVNDRLAFTLFRIEGQSLAEVAVACGCSIPTVKRRVARAQQLVDKALGNE